MIAERRELFFFHLGSAGSTVMFCCFTCTYAFFGQSAPALPALPAPPVPLPEERFASRLATGTLLLAGDARPALGIPPAALRLATDVSAIAGVSTGDDATAEDAFIAESKACAGQHGCGAPIDATAGAAAEAGAAS